MPDEEAERTPRTIIRRRVVESPLRNASLKGNLDNFGL